MSIDFSFLAEQVKLQEKRESWGLRFFSTWRKDPRAQVPRTAEEGGRLAPVKTSVLVLT